MNSGPFFLALGDPFERGRVVMGGVVKASGRANLRVTSFWRSTSGLLVDCTDRLRQTRPEPDDLLPGGNGLYERRYELPESFHTIGKHRLTGWVNALLAQGERVTAMADGARSWSSRSTCPMAR